VRLILIIKFNEIFYITILSISRFLANRCRLRADW